MRSRYYCPFFSFSASLCPMWDSFPVQFQPNSFSEHSRKCSNTMQIPYTLSRIDIMGFCQPGTWINPLRKCDHGNNHPPIISLTEKIPDAPTPSGFDSFRMLSQRRRTCAFFDLDFLWRSLLPLRSTNATRLSCHSCSCRAWSLRPSAEAPE